jgi:hypothetical protein
MPEQFFLPVKVGMEAYCSSGKNHKGMVSLQLASVVVESKGQ